MTCLREYGSRCVEETQSLWTPAGLETHRRAFALQIWIGGN